MILLDGKQHVQTPVISPTAHTTPLIMLAHSSLCLNVRHHLMMLAYIVLREQYHQVTPAGPLLIRWALHAIYAALPLIDTATLVLDSLETYIGMDTGPAPNIINGNELTWYYTYTQNTQNPWHKGLGARVFTIPDTSLSNGDSIHTEAYVRYKGADIKASNNQIETAAEVGGPYDPNNKLNTPAGLGPFGKIDTNVNTIRYRINFQNTGTAPARNIYVIDTISEHFDLGSLRMLGTSDDDKFGFTNFKDRIIRFDFRNIYLPDSLSDPSGSKGYIDFEIDLVDDLPIGTQIKNTAYIYFDYNAPHCYEYSNKYPFRVSGST